MSNEESDESVRILAACEECGSIYAAIRRGDGDVQPIGSRRGCASCGATSFTSASELTDDPQSADDD